MEAYILIGIGVLAVLLLIMLLTRGRGEKDVAVIAGQINTLQTQWQALLTQINSDGNITRSTLQDAMANIRATVEQSRNAMDSQITNLQTSYTGMATQLGKLEQLSQNVIGLQEILTKPKNRGGFGELDLALNLADFLPDGCFEMQYPLPGCSERVDAMLKLPQGMVPLDAKFPLESYQMMRNAPNDEERKPFIRTFVKSLRDRMSETAKYIRPSDGTLNFALMYIPSEAIFYEFFVMNNELAETSQQLRVFAVSPNTLDLYLKTIAIGLNGMQIEKQAEMVMRDLQGITRDFGAFDEMLETTIRHLGNAQAKLAEMQKKHGAIMSRTESIGISAPTEELPPSDAPS
jgi:DNA recombination protein RmuC